MRKSVALGVGLSWLAYSGLLWGYCLIKGFNIGPRQLFSLTTWPPGATASVSLTSGASAGTLPTPSGTQALPLGDIGTAQAATTGSSGASNAGAASGANPAGGNRLVG